MAAQSQAPINYSTRVDKVGARTRLMNTLRAVVAIIFALIVLIPVVWMIMTAFKPLADAVENDLLRLGVGRQTL